MSVAGVKENYKPSEWALRETYYKEEIDKLDFPLDVSPQELLNLISKMDKVFSEARMDFGYNKRKLESLDKQRKLYERELFILIKSLNLAGVKTVDEVNGAVTIAMKTIAATDALVDKPIDAADKARMIADITSILTSGATSNPTPIPTGYITLGHALRTADERTRFMESVIQILDQKHSSIITAEGAMKIEANLASRNSGA